MGNNLKRDATFQEISEMKYLELFLKEAQRLLPSVPVVSRYSDKDQYISKIYFTKKKNKFFQCYYSDGKFIPDHAIFNIFILAMGYNEETFPDPYRIDPLRFDTDLNPTKLNPYSFIPFSAGPRNCVGKYIIISTSIKN